MHVLAPAYFLVAPGGAARPEAKLIIRLQSTNNEAAAVVEGGIPPDTPLESCPGGLKARPQHPGWLGAHLFPYNQLLDILLSFNDHF